MGKGSPISTLTVKVHGQNGADRRGLRCIQNSADGAWREVEGGGVDVRQDRGRPGAEDGADGGEEAEGCGDDGVAGADSGGGQGQPQGIGAGRAANSMGYSELRGGGALKGGYRLAKDKLLRLKHMVERLEQFLVQRLVLALEVQHRHRHGHGLCR